MKMKKIILISLMLTILTIGAVSAADGNMTSDDLAVVDDLEMKYSINDVSDEILSNGSGNTFSDLSTLINNTDENGLLELDKDYENDGSISEDGINIEKTITIDGKGHTLDAKGISRIFKINATNVTLKNIVFKNGYSGEDGGAVYFEGEGAVTNCNFVNNKVTGDESRGGAVYFSNSGTVTNCNFTNNKATSDGGAVYFSNSGTVTNCNFTDNKATSGSAIMMYSGSVTNCNFTNNKATGGGAIYFENTGNVITCNFNNNKAAAGGAVEFYSSGKVTNCNFTNNTASSDGGAITFCPSGSTHEVTNCNFTNNTANNGGAIQIYSGSVENCNFTNNSAKNGGAIYFESKGTVTTCNFTDNTASSYGGAIYFYRSNNMIVNCNFINNTGGAIYFSSSGTTLNVRNCNFINNTASEEGGAVYFYGAGNVTNCNFTNNSAENGGAVYFYKNSNVTNCKFTDNKATSDGGAIWIGSGSVTNCNFTDNKATSDGGAIRMGSGSVTNCNFTNNSAENGGTVYFYNKGNVTNCNFIISNSEFDINNSTSLETVIFGGTISNCNINGEPVNPINDVKFETRTILSVNTSHISIGEKISIIANVLNETNINGSVDVFINGIFIETVNSGAKYVHTPTEIGVYNIMAKFKGDANYTQSQSVNKTFTVGPKVSIAQNVTVSENGRVEMEFDKNITDILVIKIDGNTFAVADIDEGIVNCTFSTSKLTARNHTVTFAYEKALFDANVLNYFDESANKFLPVEYEMYLCPKTSSQEAEVKDNNTVAMWVGENATGVVKVFVNGAEVMIVET